MYSYQGSSEIQADGLQTLYLMNPNYNGFSDTTSQQSGNMLILNYAAGNGINLETLPNGHQQSHEQHLVGVPLGSGSNLHEHLKLHEIRRGGGGSGGGGHVPHLYQSLWSSLDQTGGGNQENGNNIPSGVVVASSSGGGGPAEVSVAQLGYHMPVVSPTRQGLSLSLSSQQPGYRSLPMDHNINHVGTGGGGGGSGNFHVSAGGSGAAASSSVSVISHGIPGAHNFVLGSKYLKGAQELLDEVVSIVGKEIKDEVIEKGEKKAKMNKLESSMVFKGEASSNVCELTSAQKQEIQMKKAKLISMLDEVEQRYSQYHHQMQIVVSSFEQATGVGSARSYTQLALQTISKQFRSLKDAISSQIKAASKSLGEDEILEGKVQGSRLKFVDQQIRQQKALQHFGMMQNNNVWRPQRGLPERAVSVLRAWLFEHFLHPYPKDSDKIMLAKQAGLTRSQVSNWFINARVRLWKPMVEEMYKEEMKNNQEAVESESNKNSSSKPTSPSDQINMIMSNTDDQDNYNNTFNNSKQRKSQLEAITSTHDLSSESRFVGLIPELNLPEGIINSPKKQRHNMQNSPNSSILATQVMVHENGFGGFGELGSFSPTDGEELTTTGFHGGNGGFSLTLGLPTSQSMQQNFHLSDPVHHHINIGNYNEVIHFESS